MPQYTHGGDIYGFKKKMVDFSSNLHPLGMPEAVRKAAQAAVSEADRYPDALCRRLRQEIGRLWQTDMEKIVCGCGAADLITRLCLARKPKKALLTAPTFSEYETALIAVGCRVEHHLLCKEQAFDLTETILHQLTPDLDMVFLCSPNNPTGRLIDLPLLMKIAEKSREHNFLLVLDECFLSLTDGESMGRYLDRFPNLFLLRAFTKSYAIPGLRLGYGLCSDTTLLESLYAVGQPWSVSTVAQAAGLAALTIPDYPRQGREILAEERPYLMEALASLGFAVFEGAANYLLFQREGDTTLKERLLTKGILIRSCGNYVGLTNDYYRIAIRNHTDNMQLVASLKEVL